MPQKTQPATQQDKQQPALPHFKPLSVLLSLPLLFGTSTWGAAAATLPSVPPASITISSRTGTDTPAALGALTFNREAQEVFALLNQLRVEAGLTPLGLDWRLSRVAFGHRGNTYEERLPVSSPSQVKAVKLTAKTISLLTEHLRLSPPDALFTPVTHVGIGIAQEASQYSLLLLFR